MKVVDLTEEHLRRIKVRDLEREDLGDNFIKEEGPEFIASEFKKTLLNDAGEVIAIFGGKISGKFGVWAWLVASELINENPIASLETLLNMEKAGAEFFMSQGIRYFYTFNHPGFPWAIKFLERIGYIQKDKVKFEDGVERILLIKELI
jgi:hypothetical protein